MDLKCIDLCRSSEATASQIKNISGASNTTDDVHGLKVQPTKPEHDDRYESSDYEFLAIIAVEPSIHAIKQTSGYAREIYTEMMINNKKIKFSLTAELQ